MRIRLAVVTPCLALAICAVVCGQTVLWEHVSTNSTVVNDTAYGSRLFMPGDLNFDGVSDVLVSCASSPNGAVANAGYVGVLSGVDGAPIYELHGTPPPGLFSAAFLQSSGLAPGDVDGDGATDYWISFSVGPSAGLVSQLLSGATGTVIANPPSWASLGHWRVGDISGDGVDDIVWAAGSLTAYAGPAFTQILWSIPAPSALPSCSSGPRLFKTVVPMGDVNGDGIPDLLAGVTGRCFEFCWTAPGSAYVVSGATGVFLQQWNGSTNCDYFGLQVLSPGDLDGDGLADAMVDVPGLWTGAVVRVFSTASGNQVASYPAGGTGNFFNPHGLVALGDVDGDGFGEFAMQGPDFSHVQVISVATATILYTLNPPTAFTFPMLGESLVSPGDINGDGVAELVMGARSWASPAPNGRVRMYSLAPNGVTAFGSACPQSNGKLARIGVPHAAQSGQSFTLNLSVVPPNQGAVAVFGLSNMTNGTTTLPWNLAGYGMPSCSVFVSLDLLSTMSTIQIRPGEGAASYSSGIPVGLSGLPFFAQWAVGNPAGSPEPAAMSRALAIIIQ